MQECEFLLTLIILYKHRMCLYGRIQVSEKPNSRIFYAVTVLPTVRVAVDTITVQ